MRHYMRFLWLAICPLATVTGLNPWQGLLEKANVPSVFNNAGQLQGGNASFAVIERRQSTTTTCGFADGNPNLPRTAAPGWACRFDTSHALWGFCPATVISATDCGLAGNCVDSYACTKGCGMTGTPTITTFTCATTQFCSTVLWTGGTDLIFSYIACGAAEVTEHMLAEPTSTSSTTKPTSSSGSAAPASALSTVNPSPTSTASSKQGTSTSSSVASPIQSLDSSSAGAASSETSASSSSNIGPIIGGVLGGLAIICGSILGVVFLRRRGRAQGDAEEPRRSDWWGRGPHTSEMQTGGLHEKEGNVPPQSHEMYGNDTLHKEGNVTKQNDGVYGAQGNHAVIELPT